MNMAMPCATEIVDLVRQHQLLEPPQLEQLQSLDISSVENPRAFAQQMIQRGWLTAYQSNQLFQGRAADLVLDPYVILERLGEGGTGQVFKARHRRMRRIVALKLIRRALLSDAEVVNRFLREIHVVSQLTHPNVVHAYDAGPVGTTYFLAMEYVKGIDLACLVKQSGVLSVEHASDSIRQAALGLQHAHARGLVHRDIKPPNLMVVRAQGGPSIGVVKILDLGLARLQRPVDGEKTSLLTTAGPVMMGTPDYLAPEQALNFHEADIRADIYSLGCTFYYLLTGQPPFAGGTLAQKLLMHQQTPPPALDRLRSDVPAEVCAVVQRMLAKDPQDRFQTPAEVLAALCGQGRCGQLASAICSAPDQKRTLRTGPPKADRTMAKTDGRRRTNRNKDSALLTVAKNFDPVRKRSQFWLWCSLAATVGVVGVAVVLAVGGPGLRELPADGQESSATASSPPSAPAAVANPGSEWNHLLARWNASGTEREQLRPALRRFQQTFPGTAESRQAARLFRQLSSPLDRLDGKTIPSVRSLGWPNPELVACWGEPRQAGPTGCVAFSPDGRWLATGSEDGSVRLWDLIKGTDRAVLLTKHRTARLLFLPDSQTMAVFGAESTITLWDVTGDPPQVRAVLTGHTQPIRVAAVSPHGKLLASASADGIIRLWDLTQFGAPECGRLAQHTDHILSLAFSPDAKNLISLDSQGQIHLWEVNGRLARGRLTNNAPHGEASTLAYHPDGKSLVAAGSSNLRSFDVSGTEPRHLWDQKFGWLMSMAMAPDGQTVAGTVGNGRLILFDAASGVHRRVWHLPVKTHSIDFAPDGRHLAVACPGDAMVILRLAAVPK